MSIVTRLGKGSKLTTEEMDNNLLSLETDISGNVSSITSKLDKGTYTGTAQDLKALIDTKGIVGPTGATGATGAASTVAGPTGATGSGLKVTTWSAGAYALGDQVNHLGKDWTANAATVAGDIPGTSTKWIERLTAYAPVASLSYVQDKLSLFKDDYGNLSLTYNSVANGNSSTFINNTPITRAGKLKSFSIKTSTGSGNLSIFIIRNNVKVTTIVKAFTASTTMVYADLNTDVLVGDYIGISCSSFVYGSTTMGLSFYTNTLVGTPSNNSYIAYSFTIESGSSIVDQIGGFQTQITANTNQINNEVTTKYGDISLNYVSLSGGGGTPFVNNTPTTLKGSLNYVKVLGGSGSGNFSIRQYRIVANKFVIISSYTALFTPDSTMVFYPNFDMEKNDYIGVAMGGLNLKYGDTGNGGNFYIVNSDGTFSTQGTSQLGVEYSVKTPSILSKTDLLKTKQNLITIAPMKIYTVANNLTNNGQDALRNYNASWYLDHSLIGLNTELSINFKDAKDRYLFYAPIVQYTNLTYGMNEGVDVFKEDKVINITGNSITDRSATVKAISTKASVGATKKHFVLTIGDSITFGQGAFFPKEPTKIQSYTLLAKKLIEMDNIEKGGTGNYDAIFLGNQKRSLTFNFSGADRTITACHEGRQGWRTIHYMTSLGAGIGNPFWDGTKFSIGTWLNSYRTLDDTGTRLASNAPTKGTAVTDVNAFDVCRPTHIILATGMNDDDNGSLYTSNIQAWINTIKAEYSANGWGEVVVSVGMPDCSGTFFPSLHPKFDDSICIWNGVKANVYNNLHSKMHNLTTSWLASIATLNEDTAKQYYLPFFFVAPTAESAAFREINQPDVDGNIFEETKAVALYRQEPTVHSNPNAHAAWAYQLYSWLKYTSTL
jgi:hypothetical protein